MLYRLIYASHATAALNKGDIDQILAAARRRNLVEGVTGMLCHGDDRFLQCLEGEDAAVHGVYERISHDPRHRDIALLDCRDLEKRLFADWSMGFIDLGDLWTKVVIREMTKQEEFRPEAMDARTAFNLIKSLKSTLGNQVILE